MSGDFRALPLSNEKIARWAASIRPTGQGRMVQPTDVVALIKQGSIKTIKGIKKLQFEIVDNCEADWDAKSISTSTSALIKIGKSVWDAAVAGHPRHRFTLAHELGHIVLCHPENVELHRRTGVTAASRKVSYIKPYESAERQADEFARNLLIDPAFVGDFISPEALSAQLQVSLHVAKIAFDRLVLGRKSSAVSEGFKKLLNDLKFQPVTDKQNPRPQDVKHPEGGFATQTNESVINEIMICPTCRGPIVQEVGNKAWCRCSGVADRWPDGD